MVYNHTAEGNHLGPTLSFRGIDNAAYYRLVPSDPRYYVDYTGTGNTLNMRHPRTLQLLMDSLRYWVLDMHVDGFRFDLAATLARELHDVDRLSAFFDVIHQDPVISQVKLIAEPWDLGEGGYQVGNFPVGWAEWNGKYRDTIRRFWKGDAGQVAELAYRLTGSSDLYEDGRPAPLRQRQLRHRPRRLHPARPRRLRRQAQRGQRRGQPRRHRRQPLLELRRRRARPTTPRSWRLRERQMRNFLATLFLSQGIPMLLGGDEIGRTPARQQQRLLPGQRASRWFDWPPTETGRRLLEFTRRLIRLRHEQPGVPPAHVLPGPAHPRLGGRRTSRGSARTARR